MEKQKVYITPEQAEKGYPSRDTKNTELVIAEPVIIMEPEHEEVPLDGPKETVIEKIKKKLK